jgi:transposase
MGTICAERKGESTYYVYRESFRVKVNPENEGKTKGSGKSRVCTKAIYLGTAEKILKAIQETKEPVSVVARGFGLVTAAYQTAAQIGLQEILMQHIPGHRAGVERWVYFFVCIINRLGCATSKDAMSKWLAKTVLPELLGVDPRRMTGQNFWYAADYMLSEKGLKEHRQAQSGSDDLFAGLSEDVFTRIEMDLFARVDRLMGLSPSAICYDTTNFYTYIEEPKRSELANTCHSKASKHHLRHVGLLMAVEKAHGVPLLSQVYRANRHDSKIFSHILTDLVVALKKLCGAESDLVVVLDKGNNSPDNFASLCGVISWVGALVPSHHPDLIDLELSAYHGLWKELRFYRSRKTIMGIECTVVLTFNAATKRKQEHSLSRGIEKLKTTIREKWAAYKKRPQTVPQGITAILQHSPYGKCLDISVKGGELHIEENSAEMEARKKRFGKNLMFSNMLGVETGYLIDTYNEKQIIEDDFHLLKDPTMIRFQPIRHWTDTKIRAYAFCCVVAITLMRVMQWKAGNAGYKMSPKVLKDELTDIQEAVMVYSSKDARRKITERSAVQEKLWKTFNLQEIQQMLLIH